MFSGLGGRLGGTWSVQWLKALADRFWAEEAILVDWSNQLIVPLHNMSFISQGDNYRGIALLSIPSEELSSPFSSLGLSFSSRRTSVVSSGRSSVVCVAIVAVQTSAGADGEGMWVLIISTAHHHHSHVPWWFDCFSQSLWLTHTYTKFLEYATVAPTLLRCNYPQALDEHQQCGKGVRIVYHPDVQLVGNRRRLDQSNLEFAHLTEETLLWDGCYH